MSLPLKLTDLRNEAGLNQMELAEKLDVSRQAISRWEVGTAAPGIDNLKALSELYGVSIDYLLNDDLLKPPEPAGNPVQEADAPATNDDCPKTAPNFVRVLIAAVVITIIISVVSCVAILRFKEQNRPVPMENMGTDIDIHSDELFSIG